MHIKLGDLLCTELDNNYHIGYFLCTLQPLSVIPSLLVLTHYENILFFSQQFQSDIAWPSSS